MQIVIDISEKEYEQLQNKISTCHPNMISRLERIIYNGIPLPEHHGELIDRDVLHYFCDYNNGIGCDKICRCDGCNHYVIQERTINGIPTIIPATKEGE